MKNKARNTPRGRHQTPSGLRSVERLIEGRRGELERVFALLSAAPLNRRGIRRMVKEILRDEETETHMLEAYEAESWQEAMRDETNFYAFLSDIAEIEKQLTPSRFAEILKIAATSSREHAKFMLESEKDLKKEMTNKKALAEALVAARGFLQRRRK